MFITPYFGGCKYTNYFLFINKKPVFQCFELLITPAASPNFTSIPFPSLLPFTSSPHIFPSLPSSTSFTIPLHLLHPPSCDHFCRFSGTAATFFQGITGFPGPLLPFSRKNRHSSAKSHRSRERIE